MRLEELEQEIEKLISFFLSTLTLPFFKQQWEKYFYQ